MGQNWILVNLDKREKHEFWKLGECCSHFKIHERLSGSTFTVATATEYIDRLREKEERRRKKDHESAAKARARGWAATPVVAKVYRRIEQRQSTFLTKVPLEIISLCVGSMDTLQDTACFALTCQDAWDIARPEIVKYLRAHENWEGDRILCIGDYTRIDDITPNVLNGEELAVLRDVETGKWQPPGQGDDSESSYDPTCLCLSDFLDARGVECFFPPVKDVSEWLCSNRGDDDESWFLWSSMVRETCFNIKSAGHVVRNLTTHEYIRGDALLEARESDPEKLSPIHFWGLGDILLLRIAWAVDEDGRWEWMMKQTDAHGAWAGHRFDFAAEDDLPCDEEGEVLPPWKDVSDELIDELLRCRGWPSPYRLAIGAAMAGW